MRVSTFFSIEGAAGAVGGAAAGSGAAAAVAIGGGTAAGLSGVKSAGHEALGNAAETKGAALVMR